MLRARTITLAACLGAALGLPAVHAAGAPVVLYDPSAVNPAAQTNSLNAVTAVPGKTCGDLANPCPLLAPPPPAPAAPKPPPPPASTFLQGFTFGGSASAGFTAASHGGTGEGGSLSGWMTSPDGDVTIGVSAAALNLNGRH